MARRGRSQMAMSLFSFQDIITSVTGIIILLTLLLTLELTQRDGRSAQATETSPQPAAVDFSAEIARLESELAQLTARTEGMRNQQQRTAGKSIDELWADAEAVQRSIRALEAQIQELKKVQDAQQDASQSAKNRQDQLRRQLSQLQEDLKKQRSRATKLNNPKRVFYHTGPVGEFDAWLVEIGKDRIATAPFGKRISPVVFGDGASAEQKTAFLNWVNLRSTKNPYYFLLVRPSGIEVFAEIRNTLQDRQIAIGTDLISEDAIVLDDESGAVFP